MHSSILCWRAVKHQSINQSINRFTIRQSCEDVELLMWIDKSPPKLLIATLLQACWTLFKFRSAWGLKRTIFKLLADKPAAVVEYFRITDTHKCSSLRVNDVKYCICSALLCNGISKTEEWMHKFGCCLKNVLCPLLVVQNVYSYVIQLNFTQLFIPFFHWSIFHSLLIIVSFNKFLVSWPSLADWAGFPPQQLAHIDLYVLMCR